MRESVLVQYVEKTMLWQFGSIYSVCITYMKTLYTRRLKYLICTHDQYPYTVHTVTRPDAIFRSTAWMYMDQTLPGVESVSCFWPGYILARNCIFPMSVEKPISVSVPQNGNLRCHRKIPMVFLFPCTEISIENVTRNAAWGTRTCALCNTSPVLYL